MIHNKLANYKHVGNKTSFMWMRRYVNSYG